MYCLLSSVVEHSPCKRAVICSNQIGGSFYFVSRETVCIVHPCIKFATLATERSLKMSFPKKAKERLTPNAKNVTQSITVSTTTETLHNGLPHVKVIKKVELKLASSFKNLKINPVQTAVIPFLTMLWILTILKRRNLQYLLKPIIMVAKNFKKKLINVMWFAPTAIESGRGKDEMQNPMFLKTSN